MLAATPAPAQDALVLQASQTFQHDSNVLRLPSSIAPESLTGGAVGSRSDLVSVTSLGLQFDRALSLQRLRADAAVSVARYDRYRSLDYTGYNLGGNWDWAVGRQWYGVLGARGERYLASFVDVQSAERNVVQREQARLMAGFRFTPAWSALAAADSARRDNSASGFKAYDFRVNGVEAGARWEPRSGADWRLVWRRADGRYPNRQVLDALGTPLPVTVDNAYAEDTVFTRAGLEPSDKTRLQGELGYKRRRHESLPQRNFSGLTAGLEYIWRSSPAASLNAYARRDLDAAEYLTSSYVDAQVLGLRATLQLSGKSALQLLGEYRRLDFAGDPGFVLFSMQRRRDNLASLSGQFTYEVSRKIFLTATLRFDRRGSNYPQFDFNDRVLGLTGEIRY